MQFGIMSSGVKKVSRSCAIVSFQLILHHLTYTYSI